MNGECVNDSRGRNDSCKSDNDDIVKPEDVPRRFNISYTTCKDSVIILEAQGADMRLICNDKSYNYAFVCCNLCKSKLMIIAI